MSALCTDAAAYLLGALSPDERAAFEGHLADCADCRGTLADLAALPGLLGRVDPRDLDRPVPPPPETLLPRLLSDVRRSVLRRRLAAVGVAAAAVVLAVVATGLLTAPHASHPTTSTRGGVMVPVASTPIRATAQLTARTWGTRVVLSCRYDATGYSPHGYPAAGPYSLVVVDRAGQVQRLGTWRVTPGSTPRVTGSVQWPVRDVASVQVRAADGATVLRLDP